MIVRTVREWETINLGDGAMEIPQRHVEPLMAAASSSALGGEDGSRILARVRQGLRARQMVGVITTPDATLEILPKIGGLGADAVRHRLVDMLTIALDINIASDGFAGLGVQQDNLLEILIRLFANGLTAAVKRGMPRSYVSHRDDLSVLRGRMDIARQFTVHAVAPQNLACQFDVLSADIALNQIMKAAVQTLESLSRSAENLRLLRELRFTYGDVTSTPVGHLNWNAVIIDRTNARWADLVSLAQLLLGRRFQTTSQGNQKGHCLLFDMNTLFEAYVTRSLRRAIEKLGYRVIGQGGLRFCLEDEISGRQSFQTRPDIIVQRGKDIVLIIDTKWKRLVHHVEDPKYGTSQSDIYQMMAYGQIYQSSNLFLLYPFNSDNPLEEGLYAQHLVKNSSSRLLRGTIDVSRTKDFSRRLGDLVLHCMVPAGELNNPTHL